MFTPTTRVSSYVAQTRIRSHILNSRMKLRIRIRLQMLVLFCKWNTRLEVARLLTGELNSIWYWHWVVILTVWHAPMVWRLHVAHVKLAISWVDLLASLLAWLATAQPQTPLYVYYVIWNAKCVINHPLTAHHARTQ